MKGPGKLPAARLIFVRHGHTVANDVEDLRVSGWTDFPLSPLGRKQAAALRRRLLLAPPDVIYTSPLQRASATADALADLASAPPQLLADLREIHCGEADGRPYLEAQERFPEVWAANLRQEDESLRWPGGESYREFRDRCLDAVRRIAEAHPGERVLIVTHAGVICQVMGTIHGKSAASWDSFRPGNCSLTEIEWRGETGIVHGFDDRSHLDELDDGELEEAGGAGLPCYGVAFAGFL
jgi:alpha-ribazole phosphatase/probable phosphoglycerate mutase